MGMTIDEIIQELERTKDYPACDPASDEALDGAIDTMHKYQKIEEAYKKYLNDMATNIYADGKFIVALRGILEDGKID